VSKAIIDIDITLGIKEITPLNMVRMGLAKAKSLKMIARACWKSNWMMLSDTEVKPLYTKVMDHLLHRQPYGEFLAVQEIFGRDVAMELEKRGEVIMPAHYQRQSVMTMSGGTKRKSITVGSDEDEGSQRPGKRRAIEIEDRDSDMDFVD
jgi:hypothetical protein